MIEKKRPFGVIAFFSVLLLSILAFDSAMAEVKITFPDEELSTESVLPKFEDRVAVKNRRVNHEGRFEVNLMAGMVASEPIYDPITYGFSLAYHFDNTRGIHVMGTFFSEGLSSSGKSLQSGQVIRDDGGQSGQEFDALKAPFKEYMLAAHYQYTAYYGKISLSREKIMNLSLSGLLGGGFYGMSGLTVPTINFGVSQRLYFNSHIALRFDLLFSLFNGPDITSNGELLRTDPAPDPGSFDKTFQFDSNIYMGLSILL
jgi:outer membrane beta-barrel protein